MSFGAAVTFLLAISTLIGGMTYRRTVALREEIQERKAADEHVAILNRDLQRQVADFQTLLQVTPIGIAAHTIPNAAESGSIPRWRR